VRQIAGNPLELELPIMARKRITGGNEHCILVLAEPDHEAHFSGRLKYSRLGNPQPSSVLLIENTDKCV